MTKFAFNRFFLNLTLGKSEIFRLRIKYTRRLKLNIDILNMHSFLYSAKIHRKNVS